MSQEIKNQERKIIKKEFEKEEEGYKYKYILEADVDDYVHYMTLERIWYPNPNYGNYVSDVLEITSHGTTVEFKAYRTRMNWNGTGRDEHGCITIDVSVFQETPDFLYRDTVEQVMNSIDFEELVESILKFVIDYVIEMNILAL